MHRFTTLGATALLMLAGVGAASPASADCQGGTVWPSLDRARGTTFVGVFDGTSMDGEGSDSLDWTVERVYAGPLSPGPIHGWGIGQGCHLTGYREGTRYLVSSQFPGGGDAFDTVAYRLLGNGRVRLASFPEQPRSTAPKVYRRVDTLREAVRLLVPEWTGSLARPDPAETSSFEPVARDRARDDLFVLSIATEGTEVVADAPIEIATTLRYVGDVKKRKATVSGASGGLVAFSVEQVDGPVDAGPGWRPSCGFYELAEDEVQDVAFAKSGGFDAADPMAGFWRTWFADPELRLPEGRYVITAHAHHGGLGPVCSGPWETLTASVALEVVPASAEPSTLAVDASTMPALSPSPEATATAP